MTVSFVQVCGAQCGWAPELFVLYDNFFNIYFEMASIELASSFFLLLWLCGSGCLKRRKNRMQPL